MALAARAPDIILRNAIPLAAVSDQPIADSPKPPESASNDVSDQTGGVPKEISPEDLALAEAARKGDGTDTETKAAPGDDAGDEGAEAEPLEAEGKEIEDESGLSDRLPDWARRQILAETKKAREYRQALEKAAKAKVGSEAWDAAVNLARDKIVQQEREAANSSGKKAREAEAALEATRKELEELKARAPAEGTQEQVDADPRPSRDAYDHPDDYDEALTEWAKREGARAVEKTVAEERAAKEAEEREALAQQAREAQEAQILALNTSWTAQREAAIEKYPDYAEVAEADPADGGPTISQPMAFALMKVPNGADVAYYLGNNTDEAKRIAELPDAASHFIEIGRLAERLANPSRRRAPRQEPLEPLESGRNVGDRSGEELDMEAYAAKRNEQEAAKRRPFFPQGGIH